MIKEETPQEELENEPTTPVVEENLDNLDVSEESSEESSEEKEEKAPETKAQARERLSDRNKKLTFQAREAQRERDALRKENEELKARNALKEKPDPDNYDDHDKLEEDNKRWSQQEEDRIRADERARLKRESEVTEKARNWEQQQQKALKEDPNYIQKETKIIETLKDHAQLISVDSASRVRDLLNSTKSGTKIVSHFYENPDDLEDILDMSPLEQLRAIDAVELKVKAKAPKTISSAPNPTRSERGSATVPTVSVGGSSRKKNETKEERYARINGRR